MDPPVPPTIRVPLGRWALWAWTGSGKAGADRSTPSGGSAMSGTPRLPGTVAWVDLSTPDPDAPPRSTPACSAGRSTPRTHRWVATSSVWSTVNRRPA